MKHWAFAPGLVCLAVTWTFSWPVTWPAVGAEPSAQRVNFNRDIRPILSDTCFQCHGPDQNKRKAELRLDVRDGLFQELKGSIPVVPGKPGKSELYLRITSQDEAERMPPPKFGHQLTPRQIELVKLWIEQGAEWKGHWSHIPPLPPAVPVVAEAAFIKNDIDRFVLAKLQQQGLEHSPEADRAGLVRRLSFDLTGLPPAPEEVEAFVGDTRTDAYEQLVDRLLSSPHYGERMAIYWLDLVRFADTNGYHGDNHQDVDLFRDYVIRAFNGNKPFNRFTVEQLAGDLLPGATAEDRIGSGYNRLLMTTREGGAQAKEYAAKYAADRVRNASSVWMAATLGCAECHDHKFDLYTTRDFYSFASFFADIKETIVGEQEPTPFPTSEQEAALKSLDAEIAGVKIILDTQTPELDAAQFAWEAALKTSKVEWVIAQPAAAMSKNGATLKILDDGAIQAGGENPALDTYTVTLPGTFKGVTAIRLEALPDDSAPARGPGRASNGNFVLNEFGASIADKAVEWSGASASHSQQDWAVAGAIDGNPQSGWAILPQLGRENHAVFQTKADLGDGIAQPLSVTLQFGFGSQHTLARFRLATTTATRPVRAEGDAGLPKPIADIVAVDPALRNEKQKQDLAAHYRAIAPSLDPQRKQFADIKRRQDELKNRVSTTLVSVSMPPREMRVLPRGNWLDDSGEVVSPAVPAFMGRLSATDRATRMDLAHWMVSPQNPVVARVFVNRLWKLMFGQGIVKSLDDFGVQGSWPSHPELLDWLAIDFRDHGWDVKRTLKLLVMSGTYRQSSLASEALRQKDPFNVWLARQGRFRFDAEIVRDNALAVSGLLVRKLGGPSAKPYQPAGYWAHLNFPTREYQADHGEGLYRRGLYTYWARTFLHPSLKAFDATTREECTVERPRSNTPLQALVLLNDPTYVEAARALAERIVREGGPQFESRIQYAYRRTLSRGPRPDEVKVLAALYRRHLEQFGAEKQAADELIHIGERAPSADIAPAELAAWTDVSRVLLNLHETITRN